MRAKPGFGTIYAAIVGLAALALQPGVYASEPVLMRVYLNQGDKGDRFFVLDESGQAWFSRAALSGMGLTNLPVTAGTAIDGIEHVSLQSLQPRLRYRIDEQEPAIHIVAPPEFFGVQVVARAFAPARLEFHDDASAYLNYALNYSRVDGSRSGTLSVPLEMVGYGAGRSLYNSLLHTNDGHRSRTVRLLTSLTRDNRETMTRLTIGDFAASSGAFGSGGLFAGVSYTKNFSINPYFARFNGVTVDGTVGTPSQVEFYLGERLLFSQELAPGRFELEDLASSSGAQHTRMVIRDAFGNEQVLDGESYYAPGLLRPGVHSFSYNVGFRREDFGQESNRYGAPAVLGYHRTGISRSLTLGVRAEFSEDLGNIGSEAHFLVSRFGEMAGRLSASRNEGAVGYSGSLDYRYSSAGFSLNLLMRASSRDYASLGTNPAQHGMRYEWRAAFAMGSLGLGNLSAAYANQVQHSGDERRFASVFLSRRVGKSASLVARYVKTLSGTREHEAFIGLTWSLDGERFGGLEYYRSPDMDRLSARLARNSPLGPGFGYSIRSGLADGDAEADIVLEYGSDAATYTARYFRSGELRSLLLGTRGSVAWIGGGLHLARPIMDSFTLVDANGLGGVDVYLNNQPMGSTDDEGRLLIPRLTPYYGNRLSFDDQSIPLNYEIPALDQVSATPFRGGGITRFDARQIQGITGRLLVEQDGETNPAEYWGLRYRDGGVVRETVVGIAGEFYLENLPAGDVQVEIFRAEQSCRITLVVPPSRAMFIELGDIACAIPD